MIMIDLSTFTKSELKTGFITPEEHRDLMFAVPGSRHLVFAFKYAPGQVGEMHSHPETHLVFVRSGIVQFTVGDKINIVRAGDYVSMLPNVPHGFRVMSEDAPHLIEVVIFTDAIT
jgi:quercetin dioxygenase-like cupin family protein